MEMNAAAEVSGIWPLLIAEGILLFLVLVALPVHAIKRAKGSSMADLKGLALPQGFGEVRAGADSRGLLRNLFGVGRAAHPTGNRFTEFVAALTGIAGTVVGYYFGSGGSGAKGTRQLNLVFLQTPI